MSKKNIILVLVITIFFTIMAMALWGKEADPSVIGAESITFFNNLNQEITQVNQTAANKPHQVDLTTDITEYTFSVQINPANTTRTGLDYLVVDGAKNCTLTEVVEELDPITVEEKLESEIPHSNIYKFHIAFDNADIVKIKFTFNKGGVSKETYLQFVLTEVHHGGDIDI